MVWDDKTQREIRYAELKSASPEFVYSALAEFSEYSLSKPHSESDGELEQILAARGEKLIDLGLARFGGNRRVIESIYKSALSGTNDPLHDRGIRLAVLTNREMARTLFFDFWECNSDELRRLATEGDETEIRQLLQNPENAKVLMQLFSGEGPFHNLPPDRLAQLVANCAGHQKLAATDAFDDFEVKAALQKSLFQCIKQAPVNSRWLHALYILLDSVDSYGMSSPDEASFNEILDKWAGFKATELDSNEEEKGRYTELSLVDEFRCRFAALYGKTLQGKQYRTMGDVDDSDVAYRAAYYGNAKMTSDQIKQWRDKDQDVLSFAVLFNDDLFLDWESHFMIRVSSLGKLYDLYISRCDQVRSRHPNFDVELSEVGTAFARSSELSEIKSSIEKISGQMKSLNSWMLATIFVVSFALFFGRH